MSVKKILVGNLARTLSEEDKVELAQKVIETLPIEEWTFKLADGSEVKKVVCVR